MCGVAGWGRVGDGVVVRARSWAIQEAQDTMCIQYMLATH